MEYDGIFRVQLFLLSVWRRRRRRRRLEKTNCVHVHAFGHIISDMKATCLPFGDKNHVVTTLKMHFKVRLRVRYLEVRARTAIN